MDHGWRHLWTLLLLAGVALLLLRACGRIGVDRRDEHGMTALMVAARDGNLAEAERLVRRGASVNAKVPTRDLREFIAFLSWMQSLPASDIGYTPLMYAAQGGHAEVAEWLIRKGADVNEKTRMDETAFQLALGRSDLALMRLLADSGARIEGRTLTMAVGRGTPAAVEFLLTHGVNPNLAHTDRAQRLPGPPAMPVIIQAARRGDPAIVRLLLQAHADANARDANGWSALRWAKKESKTEVVKLLEETGLTDDFAADNALLGAVRDRRAGGVKAALELDAHPNGKDDRGVPPLLFAARNGDLESVELLVQAGADVNAATPYDSTALIAAAEGGHTAVVERLLLAGAGVRHREAVAQTALYAAVNYQRADTVRALLAGGADPNDGSLALAGLRGNLTILRLLLEHGGDPGPQSVRILSEAARGGNDEVMLLLLEHGADARAVSEEGSSPLHRAASHCGPRVVKALIARGANVNARELNGYTPLQFAALAGKLDNVRELLAAGADPNARDEDGKSALDGAARYPEVEQALRQAGAR